MSNPGGSPYTAAEDAAIKAALRAERERLAKLGQPFPQAEQADLARKTALSMRRQGQLALEGL